MRKYWSRGIVGETGMNDDNLVVIETLGRDDCEGLVKSTTLFDIIWSIYVLRIKACMESIRKKETETGRQWAIVHVIDLGGITFDSKFFNYVYGYLKLMASVYSEHSVEMNRKVVVIFLILSHTPRSYAVQYIVTEESGSSLPLGSSWKEELQRHIKPSHLPVHWGGTLVDHKTGDEFCSSLLTIAPEPVDSYYFRDPELEIEFKRQIAKSLDVPAWKSVNVLVKVGKSNCRMIVRFMAQNDYGFGAYFIGERIANNVDMIEKEYTYSKIPLENATSIYPFFHRIPGPNRVVEEMNFKCVSANRKNQDLILKTNQDTRRIKGQKFLKLTNQRRCSAAY
uniref:CRAL-TRIO domain-containing protein n=1 Tax=Romanomermis culicivorax TaxID=13658 RepID=A0A915K092_ROMCU